MSYLTVICRGFASIALAASTISHATERYVSLEGGHVPPFTDWAGAATNIQDAIEAASEGDVIWVTNGVYGTGGKVMTGDLTNRVAIDKPLTLQSVNGPRATMILGEGAVNGAAAVRCAWLTNGAVLAGFTIQGGATRTSGGVGASGGGAWCASSNGLIVNCIIRSNSASSSGGGVYNGTLQSCAFMGNAANNGSAAAYANLSSCTVVSNTAYAVYQANLTNSIVYYNGSGIAGNYSGGRFLYCCTTPIVFGEGNFTNAPRLIADGIHLGADSPCVGAGTNLVAGTDFDGESWASQPSVGCDEWHITQLGFEAPQLGLASGPKGFRMIFGAAGREPGAWWWLKDGQAAAEGGRYSVVRVTNLVASTLGPEDAGLYQVVASNALGMFTSAVARVVVRCVDAGAVSPVAPFASWSTAARTIQEAIEISQPGEIVLVTNGIYATGGKVMQGDLVNRVAVDRALFVQSVNGPSVTTIQGAYHAGTTNGATAVRCAWLTNQAYLRGFTLRGGATRSAGDVDTLQKGGGVWCASTNALVSHCLIRSNSAYAWGGGASLGTLNNCAVVGNTAPSASGTGGANLNNCTVAGNVSSSASGLYAVDGGYLTNCIVYHNTNRSAYGNSNYFPGTKLSYCCTVPLPSSNPSNISTEPQLQSDAAHLFSTSPCRRAGTAAASETDIDGDPWASPASMGCDEWTGRPLILAQPVLLFNAEPSGFAVSVQVSGPEPLICRWTRDGTPVVDDGHFWFSGTTNLVARGVALTDAGDYRVTVSNEWGEATSESVRLVIHCVDAAGVSPEAPYVSWAAAANRIQDAVDAAAPGEIVLVTNGVYASGGAAIVGELTNRVAITKRLMVVSANGCLETIIRGSWDPVSTNGPAAVRCAWIGDGAILSGFTLEGGATGSAGDVATAQSAGGAWGASTSAVLANCLVRSNIANRMGGGCFGLLAKSCRIQDNHSFKNGGGTAAATLMRCLVSRNRAELYGGGAYQGVLLQCSVTANWNSLGGGGVDSASATNCIIYYNSSQTTGREDWYLPSPLTTQFAYTCTQPLPKGPGNISLDPQMVDFIHLAVTSPCRGAANPAYATGLDIDGEEWANPPSMGCDEVWDLAIGGPLTVSFFPRLSPATQGQAVALVGSVGGRASRLGWDFGDGSALTNVSSLGVLHTWTNPGEYTVTFSGYNVDHPDGVSMSLPLRILALEAPVLAPGSITPDVFNLSFQGLPGVSYVFDQATNLADPSPWQYVGTVYSTGQVMQVPLPKGTNDNRFYRVRFH